MAKLASASFQCGWVEEQIPGPPGQDAVVYSIDVNPGAWTIHSDGSAAIDEAVLTIYKIVGEKRTDITADCVKPSLQLSESYKLTVLANGSNVVSKVNKVSSKYYLPLEDTNGNAYKSMRIELYTVQTKAVIGGGTTTEEVLLAAFDCSITQNGQDGQDGQDGTNGTNGPFTPPPQQWADYDTGFPFTDGTNGNPLYVVYHGTAAGGKMMAYMCKQNHQKTNSKEPGTNGGDQFWLEMQGAWDIIATKVLLAQNAFINFLSGNSIRLYGLDNAVRGELLGGNDILAWLGGTQANPMWSVDVNGKMCLGGQTGQRIEFDPAQKVMEVYDSQGNLVATHSGRVIDPTKAIPLGGNTTLMEATVNWGTKSVAPSGSDAYQQTSTSSTDIGHNGGTSSGSVKITTPALSLTLQTLANGTTAPDDTCSVVANVYLNFIDSNGAVLSRRYLRSQMVRTGGGSETFQIPSQTFTRFNDFTKARLEMTFYARNKKNLMAQVSTTATGKLTSQFVAQWYRCEYGANGWVISYDSDNYEYCLVYNNKLHRKIVCNGTTLLTS